MPNVTKGDIQRQDLDSITLDSTEVTSTGAELNILDGATLDVDELNILDGVTSTAAEINILDGVTATAAELNYLDLTTGAGTQEANKAVVADANVNTGVSKVTELHIGVSGSETQVTSTATELNLLDGSSDSNSTASIAPILDSAKALRTNANVGTAGTNVTAVEYGDGYNHVTVLTLTGAAFTPTIPADAEGAGALIYTFPAGDFVVDACHMDITAMTVDSATNAADMGLGSVIATGDISVLSGTATFEDYLTGQTIADVSSPATEKSALPTAGTPLLIEAAGSHALNLNIAATWNSTVATLDATGTVTIAWRFLGA